MVTVWHLFGTLGCFLLFSNQLIILIKLFCFQIQALERNPGLEEAILHDLVHFASTQGMALPYALPVTKEEQQSEHSDDPDDIEAKETLVLWNKIRYKIYNGLWCAMSSIPLQVDQNQADVTLQRRRELIQSLLFLYPVKHVWEGYIQFRNRMVEKYIISPDLMSHLETGIVCQYRDAPSTAITLAKLSRAVEIMITEDMRLIGEGGLKIMLFSWCKLLKVFTS